MTPQDGREEIEVKVNRLDAQAVHMARLSREYGRDGDWLAAQEAQNAANIYARRAAALRRQLDSMEEKK